jgi:hypothetical protein
LSVTAGTVAGLPGVAGLVTGVSVSAGSATGTPDVPPPPPPPPPPIPQPAIFGGGPRYYPAPIPKPLPTPVAEHYSGTVKGTTFNTFRLRGLAGKRGLITGVQSVTGVCSGVRWPDDKEIKRRKHRAEENDLISLGIL